MNKERVVMYLSPVTLERLALLRGWSGARSLGEVVDIVVDLFIAKFEDDILNWASSQIQRKDEPR